MKRFHFSLRPVALLRAHHEMRAQEAFALAIHAFLQAERQLAAVRLRAAAIADGLTAGRAERIAAAQEADRLAAFRQECAAEAQAAQVLAEAQQAMVQRRIEYTDAHRKLEVVRRLEEKARLAHRQDIAREEQKEFDEFASRRWAGRTLSA